MCLPSFTGSKGAMAHKATPKCKRFFCTSLSHSYSLKVKFDLDWCAYSSYFLQALQLSQSLTLCRPRMNFFCGENGSGKTAVLHGLQICLGVSVKQSGRASTGGEFIKDGSNYCKVMATLWNTGGDAYLPRKYGHEVTIVRELRRTQKNGAASSWSILNPRGQKVYTAFKQCTLN